jgi:hypothetical protein
VSVIKALSQDWGEESLGPRIRDTQAQSLPRPNPDPGLAPSLQARRWSRGSRSHSDARRGLGAGDRADAAGPGRGAAR